MSLTAEAIQIATAIPTEGDAVLAAAKWVVFIFALVGSISFPFMVIMKKKNTDKNENQIESAIVGAGSVLYSQLVKQIDEYKNLAESAFKERNSLFERVTKLEGLMQELKAATALVEELKIALHTKDEQITELLSQSHKERVMLVTSLDRKDAEIKTRDARIEHLEKAMSVLQASISSPSGSEATATRRFTD